MTAKEMFEKLDWKLVYNSNLKKVFCKKNRIIEFNCVYEYVTFCEEKYPNSFIATIPLLKAINKQCMDLGWFDE